MGASPPEAAMSLMLALAITLVAAPLASGEGVAEPGPLATPTSCTATGARVTIRRPHDEHLQRRPERGSHLRLRQAMGDPPVPSAGRPDVRRDLWRAPGMVLPAWRPTREARRGRLMFSQHSHQVILLLLAAALFDWTRRLLYERRASQAERTSSVHDLCYL